MDKPASNVIVSLLLDAKHGHGEAVRKQSFEEREMDEKVFLNKGNVKVTNSRFVVNGQTYAMSNVTSVRTGVIKTNRSGAVIIGLVGLLCLLGGGWVTFAGVVLLGFAYFLFISCKDQYSVILNASAGEDQALVSEDKSYIGQIISSLNDAIVSGG